MERVTGRLEDGTVYVYSDTGIDGTGTLIARRRLSKVLNKLADYEDFMERWNLSSIDEADRIFQRINDLGGTDLMAQYRDLGPIDHLRELIQSEQNGMINPCKRGDIVYCIRHSPLTGFYIKDLTVCAVKTWGNGSFSVFTTKDDILGKTVFLTHEEAEEALRKKKNHGSSNCKA